MRPWRASFFKGGLLDDPEGILRPVGENTRAARRIELTSREQVTEWSAVIQSYVRGAIAVEEAGLDVPDPEVPQHQVPAELESRFAADPAYRRAFEALTPGRKRSYLLHFAGGKRRRRGSGGSTGAARGSWKGRGSTSADARPESGRPVESGPTRSTTG
jgi:uncharacterized protein YdeI (YjbR/CyaY-like superfamily)